MGQSRLEKVSCRRAVQNVEDPPVSTRNFSRGLGRISGSTWARRRTIDFSSRWRSGSVLSPVFAPAWSDWTVIRYAPGWSSTSSRRQTTTISNGTSIAPG